MVINFNCPDSASAASAVAENPETELLTLQPYDIMADRQETVKQLAHSSEIETLTADIDVSDLNTIVCFGNQSAEKISKASDTVLSSMNLSQLDESSKILQTLTKIMDQFDLDEFRKEPTFFGKLFGNPRNQLDTFLEKYHTMGNEIDKIYIQLKQYEKDIKKSNQELETMFRTYVDYFHELEKYIVAGEQGCREIQDYIEQLKQRQQETGDQAITFELQTLQQALMMLEQRTQDLRTAESVALQSIPMIRIVQFSNINLVRKINSAIIVTLPVFKQALAQAIMLKRQKIQADALSALDERTNEMLLKNARTAVEQAKITKRLSANSSIKTDTLEAAWRTIITGLDETKKIQENSRVQRIQDQAKLEAIKRDFMSRCNMIKR